MPYQFHAASHAGRVRSNNEDAVLHDAGLGLALLADGMGGYNAGEVASEMAVTQVHASFSRWRASAGDGVGPRETRHALLHGIATANAAVLEAATTRPECRGMGTTLVCGAFLHRTAVIAHLGDSRCYRWRGFHLECLTRDHSVLQERIDAGLVDVHRAASVSYRHLVTRALGIEARPRPAVRDHAVRPGDLFLLCSDGLSDMLSDDAIAEILAADLPMDGRADAMIAAANQAGGRDNVSVVLVQADETDRRRTPIGRWLGN